MRHPAGGIARGAQAVLRHERSPAELVVEQRDMLKHVSDFEVADALLRLPAAEGSELPAELL
ncbi:hypothetical protein FJZ28_01730 [Candidatus Peregrinibacteria bacterium]|nr:hypothetical protein [Candidatus Peregrinibacteria bacterium]